MIEHTIIQGDCRQALKAKPDNTYHSIVTDPPYGLSFMGKEWDHGVPGVHFWQEALRVCRPGAHLLAFGGTRTHHRLMVAIEDAGWEIRDTLGWLYGSGFPKSLDVSKAIDKAAGVEREIVKTIKKTPYSTPDTNEGWKRPSHNSDADPEERNRMDITAPATDAAKQWSGWGTALKPAWEPIILARKPLDGTVAENVQKWGTGAMNIDACRISLNGDKPRIANTEESKCNIYGWSSGGLHKSGTMPEIGRFPANLIHDGSDEVLAVFPDTESGNTIGKASEGVTTNGVIPQFTRGHLTPRYDAGSAARFFYCAKAASDERNIGCDLLPLKSPGECTDRVDGTAGIFPRAGAGRNSGAKNFHPTVKPVSLIRYLCRLVTPPGGNVLDMFGGSGTTMLAANEESFNCTIIEIEPDYIKIIKNRLQVGSQLDTGVVNYRFEKVPV